MNWPADATRLRSKGLHAYSLHHIAHNECTNTYTKLVCTSNCCLIPFC